MRFGTVTLYLLHCLTSLYCLNQIEQNYILLQKLKYSQSEEIIVGALWGWGVTGETPHLQCMNSVSQLRFQKSHFLYFLLVNIIQKFPLLFV